MQDLLKTLKTHFGYDSLRPAQKPVIDSVLSGKDTIAIMPTGGGKSLCYQLPALMKSGMVLVVSPLIALMHDQVESLKENGISAGLLNSSVSPFYRDKYIAAAEEGTLKLLYVSPERLLSGDGKFLRWLHKLDISMIAIDEAHCVSQWGHDFRPQYAQLSILKKEFSDIPLIALTATADQLTRKDIIKQLQLESPQIFISSFDRPNITYTVLPKAGKDQAVQQLVSFVESFAGQSGIVYCLSRKTTEEVAHILEKKGIKATAFHAGLSPETKMRTYEEFMQDKIQVVCATIAFGMGVDKPDVRFVAHWNMPKSIEGYYQETGRAGRDGLSSEALLLYTPGDAATYRRFIDMAKPSGDAKTFEIHQKLQYDKLERLIDFCNTGHCRRRILLQYFNEELPEDCGNCDGCLHPVEKIDGTEIAQKIISAIGRTDQKFGIGYIADLLRGVENERMITYKHTSLPTFGVCKDIPKKDLMFYINQLVSLGHIKVKYDGYIKTLAFSERSLKIAQGGLPVQLIPYQDITKPKKKSRATKKATSDLTQEDQQLFEQLRERRQSIAIDDNVPAFVVFNNKTLLSIVEHKPTSIEEFGKVSGIGEHKKVKYWPMFEDLLDR